MLLGAVGVQGSVSTVGEAGVHRPSLVGAVEHFIKALIHYQGQALATIGWVTRQARPAAFYILCVRLFEALGRGHGVRGLIDLAAFGVTTDVEWKGHLGGKLACFFEHGADGVGIQVSVFGHGLEVVHNVEDFVHHELHVAQRRGVAGHGYLPFLVDLMGLRDLTEAEIDLESADVGTACRARISSKPRTARSTEPGVLRKRAS